MKYTIVRTQYWLATLALTSLMWTAPARAQSQSSMPQDRDSDLTRQQLSALDQFLDQYPELSEPLRNNASLVNNEEFVEKPSRFATLRLCATFRPERRKKNALTGVRAN
jgi:hypothetical protein